ncbi:MAG: His/Gly/Thr/Pro-type tRNA ligase C-terminal domain-containing protein, partial [Actinomycetota bacterium]|nr:His/Gly/Thr/Pro-type tRNA ligase C-terminal domain-containing protein [Actinomycetota bacterium]
VERLLLACDAEGALRPPEATVDVWVVDAVGGAAARDLSWSLRRAGVAADRAFDERSLRAQMKLADRSGARLAVIVGADEQASGTVSLRQLRGDDGAQELVARDRVVARVRELLA